MQLRTTYPGFVEAVSLYFDKLVSVIKPVLVRQNHSLLKNKYFGKNNGLFAF